MGAGRGTVRIGCKMAEVAEKWELRYLCPFSLSLFLTHTHTLSLFLSLSFSLYPSACNQRFP